MNKIRNGSSKKPNSEHLWNQSVFCKYYANCILCSTASNIFAQRWQISQLLSDILISRAVLLKSQAIFLFRFCFTNVLNIFLSFVKSQEMVLKRLNFFKIFRGNIPPNPPPPRGFRVFGASRVDSCPPPKISKPVRLWTQKRLEKCELNQFGFIQQNERTKTCAQHSLLLHKLRTISVLPILYVTILHYMIRQLSLFSTRRNFARAVEFFFVCELSSRKRQWLLTD